MPEVRSGHPTNPRQTKRIDAVCGVCSTSRSALHGSGVSTGWFRSAGARTFVLRLRLPSLASSEGITPMTTAAHPRLPQHPTSRRPLPRRRSRRRARQLSRLPHALPDSAIFYAVKANPAPEILRLLASLGSNFDCASVAEIEMALDAGATPERISFGNTIKKERDIARAHALGVYLFAVDSHRGSREDRPRRARRTRLLPRADRWRRRRMAAVAQVRLRAADGRRRARLCRISSASNRYGVSFHVGSQMTKARCLGCGARRCQARLRPRLPSRASS